MNNEENIIENKVVSNSEPINVVSSENLNRLNILNSNDISLDTKKPLKDSVRDRTSFITKMISYCASIIMSVIFILEQLHLSPIITNTSNFIIIPILILICGLVFVIVPTSINHLRTTVEERLRNKKNANNHEICEIQTMLETINNKTDELTSYSARSVMIKPNITLQNQHTIPTPKSDADTVQVQVNDNGEFIDNDGNVYVRKVKENLENFGNKLTSFLK